MHSQPMSESEGEFQGGYKHVPADSPQAKCRKCGTSAVFCRLWESSCGGYEDTKYECRACGHHWWVDGPDA